jgi:hypothetical protein
MARIAISGSSNLGKSTVIKDFLKLWPKYTSPKKTYRDILKEKGLGHSKESSEETQQIILDCMVAEEKKYLKRDYVIHDRCSLDNLVYSLWLFDKGKVSKECIDRSLAMVRESLRFIDIVFFIPMTRLNPILKTNDNKALRDTDPVYREEIDHLFKAMCAEWLKPISPFFARDDRPAIIEIFGTPRERIEIIKLYLDNDGDQIGSNQIIDPNEIEKISREMGLPPGTDIVKAIRGQKIKK